MRHELAAQVATYAHGRVPRELRRQQVLAEGRALFVERGFQGASMDELARRMGVTKPVVYDVAGSKEQLFHDVMAMVGEDLTRLLAAATVGEADVPTRVHAGILAFLRYVGEHRDEWTALLSSVAGAGPASDALTALRRTQVTVVATLIWGAAASHDGHAEVVAEALNGAVETVAYWWALHPERSAEELADLLARLLTPGLVDLVDGR